MIHMLLISILYPLDIIDGNGQSVNYRFQFELFTIYVIERLIAVDYAESQKLDGILPIKIIEFRNSSMQRFSSKQINRA